MALRYQAVGPLLAGEGSRAFLGLQIDDSGRASPVVLVWLPEGAESDPTLLQKVRRETEHAAILDHPNIVKVHGFTQLDEGHARVVEYADGESLRKVIERAGQIPPKIAAKIICDAATGVHYGHLAGNDDGTPLIHGDVRPETILASFNGLVKVTGYGALAFAPREMGGQRVKGRRVHIAPEQIIGGRDSFSLQTDVYLLGLTLYECITGVVPFADQGDFFDHAVLTLPLPPISPDVGAPEGIEAILAKACAKRVHERYPTPIAFREAIEAKMGPLMSNEELSDWLKALLSGSDEARAARRQTIEEAIKEAGLNPAPLPLASISAPPAAAPSAPAKAESAVAPASKTTTNSSPAAGKPIPAEKPPAPRPRPVPRIVEPDYEPSLPPAPTRKFPMGVIGGVAVASLALLWICTGNNEQLPSVKRGLAALADAGAPRMAAQVPAAPAPPEEPAPSTPDASVIAMAATPPPPAPPKPAEEAPAKPAEAPAEKIAAKAPTVLQLNAQPPMDVTINGVAHGRTPLKLELEPGRKEITLENQSAGIKTRRIVNLIEGKTQVEAVTVGKGTVVLTAPQGAAVFMDGKRIGTAPLEEINVYEGSHRILVTVGTAKWTENFSIHSGENVRFNVEIE